MNRLSVSALALFLPLASCDNGVRSADVVMPAVVTPASTDFVLRAVGDADLISLTAPALQLRLLTDEGSSPDLLGGRRSVDFLALEENAKWLCKAAVAPGTYTGVELLLETTSFRARDAAGGEPPVVVVDATVRGEFLLPLVVAADEELQVSLEVQLDDAVSVVDGALQINFADNVRVLFAVGESEPVDVDEVHGIVSGALVVEQVLLVEAFADATLQDFIGPVAVVLGPETALFDTLGQPFAQPFDFFGELVLGETVLRLRGQLASGAVVAQRIDIIGAFPELAGLPRVEGDVVALAAQPGQDAPGAGQSGHFVLHVANMSAGVEGLGVLAESADGAALLEVGFDEDALFLGPAGAAGPVDLALGQRVRVSLESVLAPPFRARAVELLDTCVQFSGTVAESGAPGEFALELDSSDGRLAVHLDDQTVLTVDVFGDPRITPELLPPGAEVEVRGCLGLDEGETVLRATSIEVRAGLLVEGVVSALYPETWGFSTSAANVTHGFGAGLPQGSSGPLEVTLDPQATFFQAAHSKSHFFHAAGAALDCSPGGACAEVRVRVRGIAGSGPHSIRAFEVTTEISSAPQ